MFGKMNRIYFIGIGGSGMCGIAEILLSLGFKVFGSDKVKNATTEYLVSLGATIYKGHRKEQIQNVDAVVYSSAIPKDNPEVIAAKSQKIPVIRRAEMLGELMRIKFGVSISGTHGKTTTTSMAGTVLTEAGLDPTVIVGGRLKKVGSNARLGKSNLLVAEADEFDRSFLTLTSSIAVITTLEIEHLDCYKNLDDIKNAFVQFANKVPFFGVVIVCIDESSVQDIMPRIKRKIFTYGISRQAELQARDIRYHQGESNFSIYLHEKKLGNVTLSLPGLHNVKNALAVISIGLELQVPFEKIAMGLKKYEGVKRRFELVGVENDIMVVDDYAHHPTEIKASLQGAKNGWKRRIVAVFQPHLYTRTKDFYLEFGKSFFDSDILIVTDVYAAREAKIEGVSGDLITQAAQSHGHREVYYVKDKKTLPDVLLKITQKGDMVITMGAGDIHRFGKEFFEKIR